MKFIIIIAILLLPSLHCIGQFKVYSSTRNTNLSLYKKGIKVADGYDFICYEVWQKEEPKDGELESWRNEQIKRRTQGGLTVAGFEKLAYEKTLYHIDCVRNKLRIEEVIKYAENGDVIFDFTNKNHKWSNVEPESVGAELVNVVCNYVSENKIQ